MLFNELQKRAVRRKVEYQVMIQDLVDCAVISQAVADSLIAGNGPNPPAPTPPPSGGAQTQSAKIKV